MNVVHIEAGAGEPVLLLHGYPQSASCWRHQIPALAEHHRVIAVKSRDVVYDVVV
jgi:pimeloyl-ACP methyl ester carboxylesterase